MTTNERRFKVIGTIGNGSELRPIPRVEPTYSYHMVHAKEETAIRYDRSFFDVRPVGGGVERRPILRQFETATIVHTAEFICN